MRKVRRGLVAVVLLLVVAVGGVWYLQGSRIADAEARLAAAQAEGDDLQAQVEALAPITVLTAALQTRRRWSTRPSPSQPQAALVIDRLAADGRERRRRQGASPSRA